MKKTLLIIGAIAAAAYLIISALKGTLNPFKWFAASTPGTPADGTACTLPDNTAGQYKDGVCVKKIGILPPTDAVIRRTVKCYKPAGSPCNQRISDPVLGTGTLYSQTSTTCCYVF